MRGGEAAPSVSVRTGFFPPRRPMGRVDMSPSKELVRETGFLAAAGFGLVLPAAGFLPARRAGIPSAFAVPSDDLDRNKGFLAGLGLAFSSSSFDLVRKIPVDFGATFGLDFGVVFGLAFGLVAVGFFPPRLGLEKHDSQTPKRNPTGSLAPHREQALPRRPRSREREM